MRIKNLTKTKYDRTDFDYNLSRKKFITLYKRENKIMKNLSFREKKDKLSTKILQAKVIIILPKELYKGQGQRGEEYFKSHKRT